MDSRLALATSVDRFLNQAGVASDLAAPSEPTFATDLLLDDPGVVASAAAEQLASVDTLACGVATASLRAQRASFSVRLAKVRRVLAVNQIESVRRLDGRPLRDEAVPVVARYHLRRAVERLFQPVPDVAERRHFPPAGTDRARPREPVALALRAHKVPDGLRHTYTYTHTREKSKIIAESEIAVILG